MKPSVTIQNDKNYHHQQSTKVIKNTRLFTTTKWKSTTSSEPTIKPKNNRSLVQSYNCKQQTICQEKSLREIGRKFCLVTIFLTSLGTNNCDFAEIRTKSRDKNSWKLVLMSCSHVDQQVQNEFTINFLLTASIDLFM